MRGFLLVMAGFGSSCAPVRPPPEALPGPPTTARARSFAEDLALLRARLGDFLVLDPTPGREGYLPRVDAEGRAAARSELDAWALQWSARSEKDELERIAAARARAFIAEGQYLWSEPGRDGSPLLRPLRLDPVWTRAWVAQHLEPPRLEAVERFAFGVSEALSVSTPAAADWASGRMERFSPPFQAPLESYLQALTTTATTPPPDLSEALRAAAGAAEAPELAELAELARKGVARTRQRLYARALEVAPTGPDGVDERIGAAFAAARSRTLDPGSFVLEEELLGALSPTGSSTTTTGPEAGLDLRDPVARILSLRDRIETRLSSDVVLEMPPNRVRIRVLSTGWMERVSEDPRFSPVLRLYAEGLVLERRVRAWAELVLRRDGRGPALAVLVEEGFHEGEIAEEVLTSAWESPGRFAGLVHGEQLMGDNPSCRVPPPSCP